MDGNRFGFVRFETETAVKLTIQRLHRRWVHGAHLIVSFAVRGARNLFWRRCKTVTSVTPLILVIASQSVPKAVGTARKSAMGVVDFDKNEILERSAGSLGFSGHSDSD
ncbi:hypothetical protein V6N13_009216 [Hibiscus sabdariffa]